MNWAKINILVYPRISYNTTCTWCLPGLLCFEAPEVELSSTDWEDNGRYLDLLHRALLIVKIDFVDIWLVTHEELLATGHGISLIPELELNTNDQVREELLVNGDIIYLLLFRDDAVLAEFLVCREITVLQADDGIVFSIPYLETSQFSILSAPGNLRGMDSGLSEVRDDINIC